ncbi:MAG: hypothetical protein ABI868_25310 [Acidobacteriota bacterium]
MSTTEFVFALRVAGRDRLDGMLCDVAEAVFRHLGLPADAVQGLAVRLHTLIAADASPDADVDLLFTACPGSCEVVVAAGDREIWRQQISTS